MHKFKNVFTTTLCGGYNYPQFINYFGNGEVKIQTQVHRIPKLRSTAHLPHGSKANGIAQCFKALT